MRRLSALVFRSATRLTHWVSANLNQYTQYVQSFKDLGRHEIVRGYMWLGIGRIVCYMGLMVVRRLHSRQSDLIVSRCQYECNDYNVTMLDATMARLR